MSMRLSSVGLALTLAGLIAAPACSSSSENSSEADGGTLNNSVGGTTKGGGTQSGGAANGGAAKGGATNGGSASGGIGGGAVTVAGATNGGTANGGSPSGGAATGGMATGGAQVVVAGNAGQSTGGALVGGTQTVVAGNAGKAAGGASMGGAATGGAATGGAAVIVAGSAGQGTGGAATGGAATGGVATGGVATGGAATGGLTGVAGYVSQLPPSCAADPRCGTEPGIEGSCCKTIDVPGGTFKRGRGTETCPTCSTGCPSAVSTCWSDETPENTATLSAFRLDKYLVTVARMKKFMEQYDTWRASNPVAGAGANPADPGTGYRSGWSTTIGGLNLTSVGFTEALGCPDGGASTYSASNSDQFPVNCIDWVQAFAFCIWDGGRLPSEAEWEYAAAGGSENRLYPWGATTPDTTRAVFGVTSPLLEVGSKTAGAARWGHLDMAGLVWEWIFDTYDGAYYDTADCTDCSNYGVAIGTRVLRGGSYANSVASGNLRAARRFSQRGDVIPSDYYGFRCAR